MKKPKFLVCGIMLIVSLLVQSQVSVVIHVGTPPAWGPSQHSDARFYYLPDVEAYYDIQTAMFIYVSGNQWVHRSYLPACYHNYDLYRGHKVVLTDYRGNSPYSQFKAHKMKYGKAKMQNNHPGNSNKKSDHRNNSHGNGHKK